jgi:NADH-quinone oxidoreductase subunit L
MYLLILFIPLLSFLVAALFGRFLGTRGSAYVTTLSIFITALLSTVAFYEVALVGSNCFIRTVP